MGSSSSKSKKKSNPKSNTIVSEGKKSKGVSFNENQVPSRQECLEMQSAKSTSARKMLNRNGSVQMMEETQSRRNIFAAPVEIDDDFESPVFEKAPEIVELIHKATFSNFLFEDLDQSLKDEVVDAMEPYEAESGEKIITQGEVGDYFYVLEKGEVNFIVDNKQVGKGVAGKCFGELALMYDTPRAATVAAGVDCKLWRVNQKTFRSVLRVHDIKDLAESLEELRKVEILSGLDPSYLKKIVKALTVEEMKAGDVIMKKGDHGDKFYIVKKGLVSLTNIGAGTQKYDDKECGPGAYFGERALARDDVRAADVTAKTDCVLMTLTKSQFNTLLGPIDEVVKASLDKMKLREIPRVSNSNPSEEELNTLVHRDNMVEVSYEKGTVVVKEGELFDNPSIYLVSKGGFSFTKEGKEELSMKGGDFFGEDSLAHPDAASEFTITATGQDDGSPTVCSVLSLKTIKKVFGGKSRLHSTLTSAGSQRKLSTFGPDAKSVRDPSLTMVDLEKIKMIGSGSFGKVFLVRNKKTGEGLALKVQKKKEIIKLRQVAGVLREKKLMFMLEHPFIISLVNAFQDKPYLYLVTKMYPGGELYSLVYNNKINGIEESHAQFYAAVVLEALDFMHLKSIIYRDLKPENVMIDSDGYAVIIDLGFTKTIVDSTATVCGSPLYMAPEIFMQRGYDKGADIWALGIMIYEMVYGTTPFEKPGLDNIGLMRAIVRAKFDFPDPRRSRMRRTGSPEVNNLVKKMLTKKPSFRLGCLQRGAQDIRDHEWFTNISTDALLEKSIAAPWIPAKKDHLKEKGPIEKDNPVRDQIKDAQQKLFAEF